MWIKYIFDNILFTREKLGQTKNSLQLLWWDWIIQSSRLLSTSTWTPGKVHNNLRATCCLKEWLCLWCLVVIISTASSRADEPSCIAQRHSSTLGRSTEEPRFSIPVCNEIIVTLSSTAFLSHTGLTTWTWSQMHPLQFLSSSHCSLATSCWLICTDMAASRQFHDEGLCRAY